MIKDIITYVVQNPMSVALWALGLISALIVVVEGLMKLAVYTKTNFDDKLLGKIHSVLLWIRSKLIPYTKK